MEKVITLPRIISNGFVTVRPNYIFLFGYDVMKKSMFGQSSILGHENTFPIPTLYKFCNSGARFFTDGDGDCRVYIDLALDAIPLDGRPVIPLRRMGEGCSRMKELAPKLHEYLNERLKRIAYPSIRWDYNSCYGSEY